MAAPDRNGPPISILAFFFPSKLMFAAASTPFSAFSLPGVLPRWPVPEHLQWLWRGPRKPRAMLHCLLKLPFVFLYTVNSKEDHM